MHQLGAEPRRSNPVYLTIIFFCQLHRVRRNPTGNRQGQRTLPSGSQSNPPEHHRDRRTETETGKDNGRCRAKAKEDTRRKPARTSCRTRDGKPPSAKTLLPLPNSQTLTSAENRYWTKRTMIAKGDDDSAGGDRNGGWQLFSAENRPRSWQVSWRCPGSIYKNAQAKLETFSRAEK